MRAGREAGWEQHSWGRSGVSLGVASATTVMQTRDKLSYPRPVSLTGAEGHCLGCKWAVSWACLHPLLTSVSPQQPQAHPQPPICCEQPLPIQWGSTWKQKSFHQAKCYFRANQGKEKHFETIKHAFQLWNQAPAQPSHGLGPGN